MLITRSHHEYNLSPKHFQNYVFIKWGVDKLRKGWIFQRVVVSKGRSVTKEATPSSLDWLRAEDITILRNGQILGLVRAGVYSRAWNW